MSYRKTIGARTYVFTSLKDLLAKASPGRSGDLLAGIAAENAEERAAAQMALSDAYLSDFLKEDIVPYDEDELTRLILDAHDKEAFAEISTLTVGEFRNWLLLDETTGDTLKRVSTGILPEMAAAVSKICRVQDLILISRKCRVVTKFRNTLGL
ncbi:MAG: ethanolamine ammonia lyase large subunit, partial [Spirochaetales bacterium]